MPLRGSPRQPQAAPISDHYVIQWDKRRYAPAQNFCMALCRVWREVLPITRPSSRHRANHHRLLMALIVHRTGSLEQEAEVTWPRLRPVR
jgi:hypothetical protein